MHQGLSRTFREDEVREDDSVFAQHLFTVLPQLIQPQAWHLTPRAITCIRALLLERTEHSSRRVVAFAKRCLTVALQLPPGPSLSLQGLVAGKQRMWLGVVHADHPCAVVVTRSLTCVTHSSTAPLLGCPRAAGE